MFSLRLGGELRARKVRAGEDTKADREGLAGGFEEGVVRLSDGQKSDVSVRWLPSEVEDENGGTFRVYFTGQYAGLIDASLPEVALVGVTGGVATLADYQSSEMSRD